MLHSALEGKRIFITGGAGFIGSHIARRAVRDGYDVHLLLKSSTNRWRLEDIASSVRFHEADLLDEKRLRDIVQKVEPQVIIHCAVSNIYGGASGSEEELFQTNFSGVLNLYRATQDLAYECFINTGTSSEYGFRAGPMKENDICEPASAYGIFKLAATLYGQLLARTYNKPIITLRLFSPYGPYDDMRRFIMVAAAAALNGMPLNLTSPMIARDYIYIDDVVDLYFECIAKAREVMGQVFNVGTGKQSTLGDVIVGIERVAGLKMEKTQGQIKGAPYDTNHWVADMTKTFNQFAWRPKTSLEEGLKKTFSWLKINRHLYS